MPLARKTVVEKSVAAVAVPARTSPMRAKRKATAAVAKTSKKPSTQRWTTHQRQYSATLRCVRAP